MKFITIFLVFLIHVKAFAYSADSCDVEESRDEIVLSLFQGHRSIEAFNYLVESFEDYQKEQAYIDASEEMKSYLEGVYYTVRDFKLSLTEPDIRLYSKLYKLFFNDYPQYFAEGLSGDSTDEEIFNWMNSGGFFVTQEYYYAGLNHHLDMLANKVDDSEIQDRLLVFEIMDKKVCLHFAD